MKWNGMHLSVTRLRFWCELLFEVTFNFLWQDTDVHYVNKRLIETQINTGFVPIVMLLEGLLDL